MALLALVAAGPAAAEQPPQDVVAPETAITAAPDHFSRETTPSFEFSADDPDPSSGASGFECRLDDGSWSVCESGDSFVAAEGEHELAVRALDLAGNADASPATHSWLVDRTPPEISIGSPAVKQHFRLHQGSKSYSCSDPPAGGPPAVASGVAGCSDSGFNNDLGLGPKLFVVSARDRAGNEASVERAYVIDPVDYGAFVKSQGPIAYYRMGEPVGSALMRDSSGNGHDGRYQNDIATGGAPAIACERRPQPPRACELAAQGRDYAAHFPARDGHGYANGIAAPTGGYTLEAWVRPAEAGEMMIAGHGGGGQLFISGGKLALRQVRDTVTGGGPTLAPGRWWHVAATWNGSRTRLYVNGDEVASSGAANATPSGISTFFVGYGEMAPWFHGDLDEVAYYDRALSRHALQDRYALGTAVDHPSPGPGELNTAGPEIEIGQPAGDGLYAPGKAPAAEFRCSDPDGQADLARCTATLDGAPISASDPLSDEAGRHRFVVSATDLSGNHLTRTHDYVVKGFSSVVGHDLPIAYYRLGDGAGARMVDASPHGRDGEYKNGQDSGPVGISGDGDHARAFFGDGGYGYANGIAAPRYQATLEAWINPDDGRDQAILGHGDAGELYIRSGSFRFRHMDTTVTASVAPRIGAWQQVVGVWDGAEIRIYVDGVEAGSTEATKRPSSISTFYVGFGELAPWFKGSIDEVAYYGTALSPERVLQHWLADPPPADLKPADAGPGGSGGGRDMMAAGFAGRPRLKRHALSVHIACTGESECRGSASARLRLAGRWRSLGAKGFRIRAGGRGSVRLGYGRRLARRLARGSRRSAKVRLQTAGGRLLAQTRIG